MDKRELEMYKIEDIFNDFLNEVPIKTIARKQKISKNTVKKYRKFFIKFKDNRPNKSLDIKDILTAYKIQKKNKFYSENFGWLDSRHTYLEELITKCDNYKRLIEVLKDDGYSGSYSSLIRYISKNQLNNDAPIVRIETKPGQIAQVDFGSIGKIYDENQKKYVKAYVFIMTLGFSRDAYYEIVRSQDIETWCNCHIHAFEYFRGVPKIIIPDNLKSAIIKAAFLEPIPNRTYADLAKHYGFQIDPCIAGMPEHKGKVESGVKYVKNNFLPLRTFLNFTDINQQLSDWNTNTARIRVHGTTRRKPKELFEKYEKQALQPLQSNRFEVPIWKHLKVYKDIHIQFDNAYYSVPYDYKGQYVDARKTSSQICIFNTENELIAVHKPVNKGHRATNYKHYPEDKVKYMQQDTDYCLKQANKIGEYTYIIIDFLLNEEPIRNLRGAQNILRLDKKFTKIRLENACKRAWDFENINYYTIKNILLQGIENQIYLTDKQVNIKKLDDTYSRNLKSMFQEV